MSQIFIRISQRLKHRVSQRINTLVILGLIIRIQFYLWPTQCDLEKPQKDVGTKKYTGKRERNAFN